MQSVRERPDGGYLENNHKKNTKKMPLPLSLFPSSLSGRFALMTHTLVSSSLFTLILLFVIVFFFLPPFASQEPQAVGSDALDEDPRVHPEPQVAHGVGEDGDEGQHLQSWRWCWCALYVKGERRDRVRGEEEDENCILVDASVDGGQVVTFSCDNVQRPVTRIRTQASRAPL